MAEFDGVNPAVSLEARALVHKDIWSLLRAFMRPLHPPPPPPTHTHTSFGQEIGLRKETSEGDPGPTLERAIYLDPDSSSGPKGRRHCHLD